MKVRIPSGINLCIYEIICFPELTSTILAEKNRRFITLDTYTFRKPVKKTQNEHSIAGQLLSLSITHIATVPAILLLLAQLGLLAMEIY